MIKIVKMAWIGMMLAIGAAGCVDDATTAAEGPPALPERAPAFEGSPALEDGARLSATQRAELDADPELQELRQRLGRSGETISLDEARVFEHGDKQGIVAPVSGPNGEPGEYAQLDIQRAAGGAHRLSLELAPQASPATGALKDDAMTTAGFTCGAWGSWVNFYSYCEWATACLFRDATYLVQERQRSCCVTGGRCQTDNEYREVRGWCGCGGG